MSCTVAVIGETIVDRYLHLHGDYTDHVGGSPANVARWLAAAGMATTFYTELGEDELGAHASSFLRNNGMVVASHRTPTSNLAMVTLADGGLPSYDFKVAWSWRPSSQELQAISTARHLHVGSLGSWTRPGSAAVLHACAAAVSAGATVSFDLNARPSLMPDPPAVRDDIAACLEFATIVKASDEDLDWYAPGIDVAQITQQWVANGAQVAAVTRGAEGAVVRSATTYLHSAPARVGVVDTVGAGDAWMAGFLVGWLTADDDDNAKLLRGLHLAETCATWAVRHVGPSVPSSAQVRAWLSSTASP